MPLAYQSRWEAGSIMAWSGSIKPRQTPNPFLTPQDELPQRYHAIPLRVAEGRPPHQRPARGRSLPLITNRSRTVKSLLHAAVPFFAFAVPRPNQPSLLLLQEPITTSSCRKDALTRSQRTIPPPRELYLALAQLAKGTFEMTRQAFLCPHGQPQLCHRSDVFLLREQTRHEGHVHPVGGGAFFDAVHNSLARRRRVFARLLRCCLPTAACCCRTRRRRRRRLVRWVACRGAPLVNRMMVTVLFKSLSKVGLVHALRRIPEKFPELEDEFIPNLRSTDIFFEVGLR